MNGDTTMSHSFNGSIDFTGHHGIQSPGARNTSSLNFDDISSRIKSSGKKGEGNEDIDAEDIREDEEYLAVIKKIFIALEKGDEKGLIEGIKEADFAYDYLAAGLVFEDVKINHISHLLRILNTIDESHYEPPYRFRLQHLIRLFLKSYDNFKSIIQNDLKDFLEAFTPQIKKYFNFLLDPWVDVMESFNEILYEKTKNLIDDCALEEEYKETFEKYILAYEQKKKEQEEKKNKNEHEHQDLSGADVEMSG